MNRKKLQTVDSLLKNLEDGVYPSFLEIMEAINEISQNSPDLAPKSQVTARGLIDPLCDPLYPQNQPCPSCSF